MTVGSVTNMQSGMIVESISGGRSGEIKINASSDYNGLALLLSGTESLKSAIQNFIYTFDPKKFYMSVQSVGKSSGGSHINLRV